MNKKKKQKTKMCILKQKFKVNDYIEGLENNRQNLRLLQRFRSNVHNVYTKYEHQTALSSNDNKRLNINF